MVEIKVEAYWERLALDHWQSWYASTFNSTIGNLLFYLIIETDSWIEHSIYKIKFIKFIYLFFSLKKYITPMVLNGKIK